MNGTLYLVLGIVILALIAAVTVKLVKGRGGKARVGAGER